MNSFGNIHPSPSDIYPQGHILDLSSSTQSHYSHFYIAPILTLCPSSPAHFLQYPNSTTLPPRPQHLQSNPSFFHTAYLQGHSLQSIPCMCSDPHPSCCFFVVTVLDALSETTPCVIQFLPALHQQLAAGWGWRTTYRLACGPSFHDHEPQVDIQCCRQLLSTSPEYSFPTFLSEVSHHLVSLQIL